MKIADIQLHQPHVHVRGAEPYAAWDATVVVPLDKAGQYLSRPGRREGTWNTGEVFYKPRDPGTKVKGVVILRHVGKLGDAADDLAALKSVDFAAVQIDECFVGDRAVGGGIDGARWTLDIVLQRNIIAPVDEYLVSKERYDQQKRDAVEARNRREHEAREAKGDMAARLKSFGVSASTYSDKVHLSHEQMTRLLDRLAAAESANAQAS